LQEFNFDTNLKGRGPLEIKKALRDLDTIAIVWEYLFHCHPVPIIIGIIEGLSKVLDIALRQAQCDRFYT